MSSSKKSNSKESIISTAKKPKSPPPPNSPMNWTPGKSSSRRTSVGSTKTPSPSSVKLQNKSFNRKTFLNFIKKQKRKSPPKSSPQESVASANTPLTSIQKEMVSVIKKLGFPRGNSTELRGNKYSLKFIKNNKGEGRVRVGQEAKKAQNAMNLRGVSRRLAAEAGAISPLYGIKKTLKLRRSDRIQNQKKASKSPNSKGSATKKPKKK